MRTTAAVAIGVLLGIASGILVADARPIPLVTAILVAALAVASVRLVAEPAWRSWVALLVVLGFALRFATAVLLQTGVEALGREGVTGDDGEYARLAWGFAQFIEGEPQRPYVPPYWNGSAYLFGPYVYLVTALFLIVGREPLVPIIVNAGLAAVTLVLVFDLTRRLFGPRPAMAAGVLTAFYPSLVLWSSLMLKDALASLLIVSVLWTLQRFGQKAVLWTLLATYALLWPMDGLRRYIFVGLALVAPLAVWLTPSLRGAARLRWGALATGLSAVFLLASQASVLIGPTILTTLEFSRSAMAANARTGFVERAVHVRDGDIFIVPGAPVTDALVVVVRPDARILVDRDAPRPQGPVAVAATPSLTVATPARTPAAAASSVPPASSAAPPTETPSKARPGPSPSPSVVVIPPSQADVVVRPGDVIVVRTTDAPPSSGPVASGALDQPGVGTSSSTPSSLSSPVVTPPPPVAIQRDARVLPGGTAVRFRPEGTDEDVVVRTGAYLPVGIVHALLAPYPWDLGRALDRLTIPEMLLWYGLIVLAVWSVGTRLRRWRELAPLVAFASGTLLIFALAEGNVGTLFRHRAMVILPVIVLASPGIVRLGSRVFERAHGTGRTLSPDAAR